MSEMRQIANKEPTRPRQKTPNAPVEAQALPEVGIDYMTASPVCLPLVSESKKLVCVDSRQIDLQLDGAAELNKAFNRFPYLTDRQTAALAHRCSLHPDQVKVWFMTQRLRYGISWDCNDICDVWRKFEFSQEEAEITKELHKKMQEGFNKERGNIKQDEEKITECGGMKTAEEPGAKKKEAIEQTGTTNKQLDTNTEQKQPMKQKKNKNVDRICTPRKRKRVSVMGQSKKRMEAITEKADRVEDENKKDEHCEEICCKMQPSVEARCTKKKEKSKERLNIIQESLHMSPFGVDIPLDLNSLFIINPQTQTLNSLTQNDTQNVLLDRLDGLLDTPNIPTIPINSRCEGGTEWEDPQANNLIGLTAVNNSVAANNPPILTQMQDCHDALAFRSSCNPKTPAQVKMLKMAFLNCQYPDQEYYRHVEELTGISRQVLVQWFADMRYAIKKSKPRWMSEEQHKHALFNVMYHQSKKVLSRKHQATSNDSTTMMMTFEGSRSHEEGFCVNK